MALKPEERRLLSDALLEAFPTYPDLNRMLSYHFGKSLAIISGQKGLANAVFDVIQYVEARDQEYKLVEAARNANRDNLLLIHVAKVIGAVIETPSSDNLEKILNEHNMQFDVVQFLQRIGTLDAQVCRIEIGSSSYGTGFLVGPDVVLTNYHVIESAYKGEDEKGRPVSPTNVVCRFDYKKLADGVKNKGTEYRLADDWLIGHSPYSEQDKFSQERQISPPQPNELDFALIRLSEPAGSKTLGNSEDGEAPKRGFVDLSIQADDGFSNKVLYILQHPSAEPLKLTVNTFRNYNQNKTRVTYFNDTEPGSSGSPCFNANWELVALHHSGDPSKFDPEYNEGIPIARIVEHITEHDLWPAIIGGHTDDSGQSPANKRDKLAF